MARVAGVNIPDSKHIRIALLSVYGIGPARSLKVCEKASVSPTKKVIELGEQELEAVRNAIATLGYTIEGDLRREVAMNIKRLMELGTYRGQRHRKGLPVRGQRTKTNARTRKGKRSKSQVKK